jgi:hypothetical protein
MPRDAIQDRLDCQCFAEAARGCAKAPCLHQAHPVPRHPCDYKTMGVPLLVLRAPRRVLAEQPGTRDHATKPAMRAKYVAHAALHFSNGELEVETARV